MHLALALNDQRIHLGLAHELGGDKITNDVFCLK